MLDKGKIKRLITSLLESIGEDINREGLVRTPERYAQMCTELFSGYNQPPSLTFFEANGFDQLIVKSGIEFFSMCEHHLLPFWGTVAIGYLPKGKIIGASKLARVVDHFSRKLQLQERMTEEIADFLMEKINPKGVIVVVRALHLCEAMRGVKQKESELTTSAIRGDFVNNWHLKMEFLELIK